MKRARLAVFLLGAVCGLAPISVQAWPAHGISAISAACQPKGAGLSDLGGTPDDSAGCTPNGSFQSANFFNSSRQTGQAPYSLNDATLHYNVNCVDNTCGYNTVTTIDDPANVSFSASSASITSGVLSVPTANLDTNNGNPAINQILGYSGVGAAPKIVSFISSIAGVTKWQLDQGSLTVASTAIFGSRYPQIGCNFQKTVGGANPSSIPVIDCATTGDTTTPTLITNYDSNLQSGIWIRINPGSGGGANGAAGPVTITSNKFVCNPVAGNIPMISTGVGTHFDLTVTHNGHDGGYPNNLNCISDSFLNTNTVGTIAKPQILDVEWNAMENEPVLPMAAGGCFTSGGCRAAGQDPAAPFPQGGGYQLNVTIANNAVTSSNLSGAFHGAVFALNTAGHVLSYVNRHNLELAYPAASPASLGTTTNSVLANAANYTNVVMDDVEFLGNIVVTNNSGGTGAACSTNTVQTALWQFVDPPNVGTLVSKGNLTDPTGATGCSIYHGGLSRNPSTATVTSYAGTNGVATINVSSTTDVLPAGSFVHISNTPLTFNGRIAPSGLHDGLGLMTLDAPNASLGLNSIAGILVPPGMYITSVVNTSNFKVANYFGTDDAHLTAGHQSMYTAFTILPYGTIDPGTGLASTGTGGAGTYEVPTANTGNLAVLTTWRRYNPTISNYPAQVNAGNDFLLTTGAPTYLGGSDWSGGIAP